MEPPMPPPLRVPPVARALTPEPPSNHAKLLPQQEIPIPRTKMKTINWNKIPNHKVFKLGGEEEVEYCFQSLVFFRSLMASITAGDRQTKYLVPRGERASEFADGGLGLGRDGGSLLSTSTAVDSTGDLFVLVRHRRRRRTTSSRTDGGCFCYFLFAV